jgi:Phosphoinositide phospholipase C, Ca2+-dependent
VPLFILIETKQGPLHLDFPTAQPESFTSATFDALVLPSGAQMLSTDFPASEPAATGFTVALPGAVAARCNPVLQPKGCRDALLDLP